jgi:SAM-dependent methyltransferase
MATSEQCMDEMELLVDLHRRHRRQGPGGDAETERAVGLAGLDRDRRLKIADIGCGTGASTRVLACLLDAEIIAVDMLRPFLDELAERATREGWSGRIRTLCCGMEDLPFEPESLDVIWCEGAIYNIGFERGIADWWPFLRPGGVLVASEISWLTAQRPPEIERHWQRLYREIDTASAKIGQLESHGYSPRGYFVLPEHCWTDHYYTPIEADFEAFLERHDHTAAARAIVEAERAEIDVYNRYQAYFGYGVYVAARPEASGARAAKPGP